MPFSYSNINNDCVISIIINEDIVKKFKPGKELTVRVGVVRSKEKLSLNIPLKKLNDTTVC